MREFLLEITGVEPRIDEPGFVVIDLASGDRLDVWGAPPGEDSFMVAPVAGFLVENLEDARAELVERGIEFLDEIQRGDDGNCWSHFRAPDGHVYELTEQPGHPAHET
jgi:hypothetical protein